MGLGRTPEKNSWNQGKSGKSSKQIKGPAVGKASGNKPAGPGRITGKR